MTVEDPTGATCITEECFSSFTYGAEVPKYDTWPEVRKLSLKAQWGSSLIRKAFVQARRLGALPWLLMYVDCHVVTSCISAMLSEATVWFHQGTTGVKTQCECIFFDWHWVPFVNKRSDPLYPHMSILMFTMKWPSAQSDSYERLETGKTSKNKLKEYEERA